MTPRSKHRTPRTEARMRIVVDTIASYGDKAFPKQKTLARQCRMTVATLARMLDNLKRDGLLKIEKRGPTSALYLLKFKPEMARTMARSLAKSKRFYPYMSKRQSEEEQMRPPSQSVENPATEETRQVEEFAAAAGLPLSSGADFFRAMDLMLERKPPQAESGLSRAAAGGQ